MRTRPALASLVIGIGFVFVFVLGLLNPAWTPEAHARKKKDSLADAIAQRIDAALVSAPKDEETCFSPDQPCDIKLVKFIDSAQASIDVAIYDINLDQVVHHLLVKSRQIPVRIIVDRRQAKGDHSLVGTLIKGGANVRFGRQRGIMHDKFTLVDGKMLELGSFNYTNHATQANQENQLYLAKPSIVDSYRKRFDAMWSNATPAAIESR